MTGDGGVVRTDGVPTLNALGRIHVNEPIEQIIRKKIED